MLNENTTFFHASFPVSELLNHRFSPRRTDGDKVDLPAVKYHVVTLNPENSFVTLMLKLMDSMFSLTADASVSD